jgi:hypothetical protein
MSTDTPSANKPGDLTRILERHRAFWDRSDVDEPLVRVTNYSSEEVIEPLPLVDGSVAQDGDLVEPEKVSVDRITEAQQLLADALDGDFLRGVEPYDLCWTEVLAGCGIRWQMGNLWAEPYLEDLSDPNSLRVADDNPWMAKFDAVVGQLVDQAAGRYPITQPSLRGPIDIAAAAVGDTQICMAAMEDPEPLGRFLEACTDVFLAAIKRWRSLSPLFEGGTCKFGIWAPGTIGQIQCDGAALLSPDLYETLLVPCDTRICEQFDFPIMHTHGSAIKIVADALIANPGLRAIQVSTDYPAGPPFADLLPTLQKINAEKPLIVTGGVSQDEFRQLKDGLDPRGLCLLMEVY